MPASSTTILSPSYCGWYFPARLYKKMSNESHSAKLKPGGLDTYSCPGKHKDTSESRVLVMVERHFSTNPQGQGVAL